MANVQELCVFILQSTLCWCACVHGCCTWRLLPSSLRHAMPSTCTIHVARRTLEYRRTHQVSRPSLLALCVHSPGLRID